MSGLTHTQRFEIIESNLNKIMEVLSTAATVDDAATLVGNLDSDYLEILRQIKALQEVVAQLQERVKLIQAG